MIKKVAQYIKKEGLLTENDTIIVALSGGADSVALLHILLHLGYRCMAVHCNFHLRGNESMRDEEFVRSLCKSLNVPLEVVDFDTEEYAKEKAISIEMAARELRYAYFEEKRNKEKAAAIAVAHHKDDCAETMLLNMIRGTGIKGLHGILPKNGYIIRPLLCLERSEILDFMTEKSYDYVTDSTNLKPDYKRNKVRLEIIPLLKELNPSITDTLCRTANNILQAERVYDREIGKGIERVKEGNRIDLSKLSEEISPQALLHEILSPLGFNSTQVYNLYTSAEGNGSLIENSNWMAIKERQEIIIHKKGENVGTEELLPKEGSIVVDGYTLHIEETVFNGEIPKSADTASLDLETLQMPLRIRNIKAGDRFIPFGMRGSKLISDYLTDRKRTLIEKQMQLVVTDNSGNIVWLVGERPAAPYCVGKKTKKLLRLKWQRS